MSLDSGGGLAILHGMKPRPIAPKMQDYLGSPDFDLMKVLPASQDEMNRSDRYLSWGELRYKNPPKGITNAEWWIGLKIQRLNGRRATPLTDKKGVPFTFSYTNMMLDLAHRIDLKAGGALQSDRGDLLSAAERNKYLLTSIVEESIMSSMLEGAVVTRSEAKELLRTHRKPVNEHERMVMNNYLTMQKILAWRHEELTPDKILALHRCMTDGTLRNPAKVGVLRAEEDDVRVETAIEGELIHTPPPAAELPARLQRLCDFANEKESPFFLHPVVRAIILHFWLAYDHPFVDGNGRTARALFYWMMLREGFWAFEYISVSREIFSHSKRYYDAFLHTEEDDNDLNYFICDQLRTIEESITHLYEHLQHKVAEQQQFVNRIKDTAAVNHRQRALLVHILKHPEQGTNVSTYCNEHRVVRQTARTDLAQLVQMGLLRMQKVKREFVYYPVADLEQRLKEL